MESHYPRSYAGEAEGTATLEAGAIDTSALAESIETARARGHGNLDVPQPEAFFDQDEAWRTSGSDEDVTPHEDLSTGGIPRGVGAVSGFATASEYPRHSSQIGEFMFTEVPTVPCICPKCHIDDKVVELQEKLPDRQEQKPFRYPGQPQITNLLLRRRTLICPQCQGEFSD
jgi:hypothetical protein